MGIHKDIRQILLKKSVAHAAFISERPDAVTWFASRLTEWKNKGVAVVEDSLTRMNAMVGPRGDYSFSGIELLNAFTHSIGETMTQWPCMLYIAILDDQQNVPVEKRETQQKRSIQCKHEPYPFGCSINDDGICLPTDPVPERMDLRRIMRSRHLRRSVWAYIRNNLPLSWLSFGKLPEGSRIVLEYEKANVNIYTTDEHKRLHTDNDDGSGNTDFKHDHGEADRSMIYWMNTQLKRKHTILRTIDTDVIPISYLHIYERMSEDDKADVLWEYKANSGHRAYVDLKDLAKQIRANLKLEPTAFAMFCILCGTDYVKKEWLTHFISIDAILEGVQKFGKAIQSAWNASTPSDSQRVKIIKKVLAYIYYNADGKAKRVMEALSGVKKKKAKPGACGTTAASDRPPAVKGQLRLDGKRCSDDPGYTPEWDEIYKALTVAVDNAETLKKEAAKAKAKEARKRKRPPSKKKRKNEATAEYGDNNEEEEQGKKKKSEKLITTALRPPNDAMITHALTRIQFNIQYWSVIPGTESATTASLSDSPHDDLATSSSSSSSS